MSLLLEALKKAEAAKRRDEDGGAEVRPPEPPPAPRITPAHELELIDDEIAQAARFAGLDVPEPTPAPAPAAVPGAEAARLLFEAKQPQPSRSSSLVWLLGGGALLLLAVGAWVVWQVRSLEGSAQTVPTAHQPPLAQAQPATPVAGGAEAPATVTPHPQPADAPAAAAPTAAPVSTAQAPVVPPPVASPPAPSPASAESSRFLSGQLSAPAAAPAPAPSAPATAPIRITRNAPVVPQDVADGYAAFQAGEFDRARLAYERALRADPRNPDALHGLSALAQRNNDEARARQLMRRIAEVDPSDTAARVALSDHSDPATQEARLLDIAAAQPKSSAAALALGSLYASQGRWREAQQAWFTAYTLAPEQPDNAYNLAVSLDQLRQPRLALQYYREALAQRERHAASFDADAVASRIQALQAQDGR
ncbi:tetratricopeptide repeat protein [Methyloversatilis universalis]|uniref:tetratricopeptide repeat protein n=1 Tax=Methyloversatilis universalis TaxID=378211 RepID=UPI0003600F4C|nr:tetratricopeptide repeat protein [Methyloversatilis universalis]